MADPASHSVARFFGGVLMAAGVMLMVLCGGCGAVFFGAFLLELLSRPHAEDVGFLLLPLFLGGVPAAGGLGLFIVGRALRPRQTGGPRSGAFD